MQEELWSVISLCKIFVYALAAHMSKKKRISKISQCYIILTVHITYCCSQIQGCSYHFDCSEVRPKRSDRFWQIMGHSQRHILNSRDRDSRLRRDGHGRGNLLRINVSRRPKILRIPKFLRHYGVLKLNKNKKKVE